MKTQRRLFRDLKIWSIQWLRGLKLIPNKWYQCEIEASKEEAKEMAEFFNKDH